MQGGERFLFVLALVWSRWGDRFWCSSLCAVKRCLVCVGGMVTWSLYASRALISIVPVWVRSGCGFVCSFRFGCFSLNYGLCSFSCSILIWCMARLDQPFSRLEVSHILSLLDSSINLSCMKYKLTNKLFHPKNVMRNCLLQRS